jgi:hypothetical protein
MRRLDRVPSLWKLDRCVMVRRFLLVLGNGMPRKCFASGERRRTSSRGNFFQCFCVGLWESINIINDIRKMQFPGVRSVQKREVTNDLFWEKCQINLWDPLCCLGNFLIWDVPFCDPHIHCSGPGACVGRDPSSLCPH